MVFSDGSVVKADVVIYATGYKISFPFLPETVMKVDDNKVALYKYVFSPEIPPTLAHIGLVRMRLCMLCDSGLTFSLHDRFNLLVPSCLSLVRTFDAFIRLLQLPR